jgi:hypothetical protein
LFKIVSNIGLQYKKNNHTQKYALLRNLHAPGRAIPDEAGLLKEASI